MRNEKNTWSCLRCDERFKSDAESSTISCPSCGFGEVFPEYPKSRVRGDKFRHYTGNSSWETAANAAMKDDARYNFENKQHN
jgi:DNA-directed RNA polymerase subunit RPC12/RpoP